MKRDWISKRRIKRAAERVMLPERYELDTANASCIEGGSWDYPNGIGPGSIWQPDDASGVAVLAR
jgi:hypothetical protein